jgi:hypothetical protein
MNGVTISLELYDRFKEMERNYKDGNVMLINIHTNSCTYIGKDELLKNSQSLITKMENANEEMKKSCIREANELTKCKELIKKASKKPFFPRKLFKEFL